MLGGFDCIVRKVVENGKPIFPEAICLTEEERIKLADQNVFVESVERLKITNGTKFYAQYGNDPLDEENLEFKRVWFQKFDMTPDLAAQMQSVPVIISIDPAFRLHQYNDFTGICVTKTLANNNVYVLEARKLKVNPDSLVKEIFSVVDRYQYVKKVLVETVTSQIMLMNLLQAEMKRRNKFFVIEEVKPENNERKTVHIRSLIPHYANRRIFHANGLHDLEEQLLEFPKGAHDDIIDALAYQVKYWQGSQVAEVPPQTPEGSYAWWRKKAHKQPLRLGSLFRDFRNRR